jgi:hypothetical protein
VRFRGERLVDSGPRLNRISGLATRLLARMLYFSNKDTLTRLLPLTVDRQMLRPHHDQHDLGVPVDRLERCMKTDECQKWAKKAEALASHAKQANAT